MKVNAELLKACRKGERRAQFELYRQCYPLLMSVCLRYASNEEDATALLNLGFYKVLTKLDRYKPKAPFAAWARRLMINTIIDEYRKNRKYKENTTHTEMHETNDHIHLVDFNEADQAFDAEAIEELVQLLPDTTRKAFNLFAIDGYAHKEIAEMLDISEGTSKWHVSSARKQLRAMLHKRLNAQRKRKVV